MKIFKKAYFKNVTMISLVILLGSFLLSIYVNTIQYQNYQKKVNIVIANMIGEVKNQYPEIEEEKIVQFLQSKVEVSNNGSAILQEYGIKIDEIATILELEREIQRSIFNNTMLLVIAILILFILFVLYLKSRDKKVNELVQYIEEINQKNYILTIDENTEDGLSCLRNELYKTTVMLKEQAEFSQKERLAISDSVSDISHQLKTPLTSISIMLDNIKENPNMKEETRKEFIYEISRQIDWINWLVVSLLKLSKLDAGTIILKRKEIQVSQLINTLLQNLSIPLEIKNIEVIVQENKEVQFEGDFEW